MYKLLSQSADGVDLSVVLHGSSVVLLVGDQILKTGVGVGHASTGDLQSNYESYSDSHLHSAEVIENKNSKVRIRLTIIEKGGYHYIGQFDDDFTPFENSTSHEFELRMYKTKPAKLRKVG